MSGGRRVIRQHPFQERKCEIWPRPKNHKMSTHIWGDPCAPKNIFHIFWPISGVATPQSSGSNPDRSPAAQWLNMRISPASCRLQLPASASRGPVKTLSRPARRWRQAPAAGKAVRNQHRGQEIAYSQNSCVVAPPRRWWQARVAGKVLRNQHRGRNFASSPKIYWAH